MIILDPEAELKTEADIDFYVSAEIPDKDRFPLLHKTVTRNMIHTPCGNANLNSPCIMQSTWQMLKEMSKGNLPYYKGKHQWVSSVGTEGGLATLYT